MQLKTPTEVRPLTKFPELFDGRSNLEIIQALDAMPDDPVKTVFQHAFAMKLQSESAETAVRLKTLDYAETVIRELVIQEPGLDLQDRINLLLHPLIEVLMSDPAETEEHAVFIVAYLDHLLKKRLGRAARWRTWEGNQPEAQILQFPRQRRRKRGT
jgi:hypothetical protein